MRSPYADIVLRLAVPGTLQFAVPEHLQGRVVPGQRVRVPLRRGFDIGYVASLSDEPKVKGIRPIAGILEEEPLLPRDLLTVLLWVGEHFLAPPGLVFRSALPRSVHLEKTGKGGGRELTAVGFQLCGDPGKALALARDLERRAPLQARLLRQAAEGPVAARGLSSSAHTALRALAAKGLLREERRTLRRGVVSPGGGPIPLPELTPPQQEVLDLILPSLPQRAPSSFLLHGVTGSGKSEVYVRALLALPPERHAIIMVPEVSLTSHLVGHFQKRLPWPVGVWHHQLSEGEKYDLWRAMRRGEVRVVIGARSAVFAPFPDLGLIVLDEEHDSSYKQDEAPAYHTREVALRRAELSGATVVLGSATPSLESYYRAEQKEHTLLRLQDRYGGLPLPEVEIIDLRDLPPPAPGKGGGPSARPRRPSVAPLLQEAADEVLRAGSQVLFFLNRRGYAPFTHCGECGWAFKCPNCQVALVFHSQEHTQLCHYCGFKSPPPETCPSCRGTNLRLSGSGTQRLEEEIARLFPGRSIARLDRDAAARKGAGGRVVRDFASGRTDILIGTQMATKGFHFPRLSLVGVLAPDIGLNLPDFRAAERTFQLVTQAAGRAGREEARGRVLIQTYQPEHYALQAAARHDFVGFYRQEIEFRRELDYPPFCDLILLRTEGPNPDRTEEASERLAAEVRDLLAAETTADRCRILGPVEAPLRKIRNLHRFQILVKSRSLEKVSSLLREAIPGLHKRLQHRRVRLSLDVNPLHLM